MIFDSRDERCKRPYGAAPCSTVVSLTLRPPVWEDFSQCIMVATAEFSGARLELPLENEGMEGDRQIFSGAFHLPLRPDLVWYCFRFRRENGEIRWLGRNGLCGEGEAVCWQQTVYDDACPTPDWFGRGVTYQIFPDRFRRTCVPDRKSVV